MRIAVVWRALVVAMIALVTPAVAAWAQPAGTLLVGLVAEPVNLDPAQVTDLNSNRVGRRIVETLVTFPEESTQVVPGLAESWTISKDGRSVVVNFRVPGTPDEPEQLERTAAAPLAAVAAVQKAHPDLRVEEYGVASQQKALGEQSRADESRSLQLSMAGTLIILLLAFGAAVAAGVPLFLGLSAVIATTGLLGPVSRLAELHQAVGQVVLLVGLAVGVDYAMFYLRRTMEEHWASGYDDALDTLRHPEIMERPTSIDGVETFDFADTTPG